MRYPPEVSGISTKDGGSQPKMYFFIQLNVFFIIFRRFIVHEFEDYKKSLIVLHAKLNEKSNLMLLFL